MLRWLAVSALVTATAVAATVWLAWEARRTERLIAAAFKWDTAAGERVTDLSLPPANLFA